MIPKILHQIWLGNRPMPEEFKLWIQNWRKYHPEWTYMLHTDKDIPEHLRKYIDTCKHYSSKSNIMRLHVVYKYGGVYCDTDFDWNKNIDCFLDNKFIVAEEIPGRFCNAFFGSIANSNILKEQLDCIEKYCTQKPPWGPGLMTLIIKQLKNTEKITVLPTEYVYPYLWNSPFRPASDFPDAYLVHHWRKSWF